MFMKHGLDVSWNSMPDCEALISPSADEYAKRYISLLKITPLSIQEDGRLSDNATKNQHTVSLSPRP